MADVTLQVGVAVARLPAIAGRLLVIWLPPVLLVVDALNGALVLRGGSTAISQATKSVVLAVLVAVQLWLSPRCAKRVIVFFVVLALWCLWHFRLASNQAAWQWEVAWVLRFALLISMYWTVREFLLRSLISIRAITIGAIASLIIIAISLGIGLLGVGFSQYGDRFGTSGLFVAGNELAVATLASSIIVLGYAYQRRKRFGVTLGLLFLGIVAVIMLTKALFAAAILLYIALPAFEVMRALNRKEPIGLFSLLNFVLIGAFAVLLVGSAVWYSNASGFTDRILFFLERQGVVETLLSGRASVVYSGIDGFLDRAGIVEVMFGVGVGGVFDLVGHQIESDPVDVFLSFGLIGVALAYGLFLWPVLKGVAGLLAGASRSAGSDIAIFGSVLIVAISIVAGHVLNSGLAAIPLGILLALSSVNSQAREYTARLVPSRQNLAALALSVR